METVQVTILPGREVRDIDARTVADLLEKLHVVQDACLVIRGQDILTRDVRLSPSDQVEIWPVISGGRP